MRNFASIKRSRVSPAAEHAAVAGPAFIQRKCAHCEMEDMILRKPSGSPLDPGTRTFMESRMGADLGNVQVHTDNEAAQLSRRVNARAFTYGRDVFFNEGEYNPGTPEGKRLLAHELAHTQQQSGTIRRQSPTSPTSPTSPASPTPPTSPYSPGFHPALTLDPDVADLILTEAVRGLGDFQLRGRLTNPLNLVSDATRLPNLFPPSLFTASLGYNDRCNRAFQSLIVELRQQQSAGRNVFDFSRSGWSLSATGGFRFGGLRIDAGGEASFVGDRFDALFLTLNFTRGVSTAIPDECRNQPDTPGRTGDREPPGGGDRPPGQRRPPDEGQTTGETGDSEGTPYAPSLPPRTVYFFYDTPVFKPESNDTLAQVLDVLRFFPTVHVRIAGHTSMEGSERYNMGLSQRRAAAVRDYLVMQNIEASRCQLLPMGELAPAVHEPREPAPRSLRLPAGEAIRDLNRRAELVFFDPTGTVTFLPRMAPFELSTLQPFPAE